MAVCVGATDFIGGGTGALDAYDGAAFSAGDAAMVYKNGQCIPYIFTSSSLPENSPWVIQPDTNGTGVRWIAVEDSNLNTIRSNLTIYCSNSGNDTTGDGSASYPWKTLNKAVEWLGDKQILSTVTVTISFDTSTIAHTSTVIIDGPQFRRVVIDGNGSTNSVLTWAAAGVGGILIDNGTFLKDIKDIKLVGDGTNGYGIQIDNISSMYSSGDLVIDNFGYGAFVDNDSYINADGVITFSNNNADGCRILNESAGRLTSCVFNANNNGLQCSNNGTCNASSSTSTNNTTYGYYSTLNSWIKANGTTVSGNGTDYSPAKTTANDPTFGNFGSWIYG